MNTYVPDICKTHWRVFIHEYISYINDGIITIVITIIIIKIININNNNINSITVTTLLVMGHVYGKVLVIVRQQMAPEGLRTMAQWSQGCY